MGAILTNGPHELFVLSGLMRSSYATTATFTAFGRVVE
jgi:hypothetical protein